MDRNDKKYSNFYKSTMTNTTIISSTRACGISMLHIPPTNHHLLAHSFNKVIRKKGIRQKEQLDEVEDVDKRGDRKIESNHSPGIPYRVTGWWCGGGGGDIRHPMPPFRAPSVHDLSQQGHNTGAQTSELDIRSKSYPLQKTAPAGSPLSRAPPSRRQWDESH